MAANKKKTANKKGAQRATPPASNDEMKKLYRSMLLIRRFEEKAGQMYGMGLIGGFCHLYIGQEAVVTGIQSMQKPEDSVVTAYRDHGHMLATGMDPKGVMAELTGRESGYSRGKGGSMHMFSKEKKFYGGHGIVGASTSIGTGLGFSHKYREDGGVAVAYMGDGAANQGQVAECYNMAALWKLPVLYVVENNQYGMGTSVARHAAGKLYAGDIVVGVYPEGFGGYLLLDMRRQIAVFGCGDNGGWNISRYLLGMGGAGEDQQFLLAHLRQLLQQDIGHKLQGVELDALGDDYPPLHTLDIFYRAAGGDTLHGCAHGL